MEPGKEFHYWTSSSAQSTAVSLRRLAPVPGIVIDQTGQLHRPNVVTMRSEAVRDIKPSRILAERLRAAIDFLFVVEAANMFFSYRSRLYHDLALAEARIALREGRSVPWLN